MGTEIIFSESFNLKRIHFVYKEYQHVFEIGSLGALRAEIFIDSISSGSHFGIQDGRHKFGRITCGPLFSNKA